MPPTKKRVMITISPEIYEKTKLFPGSFSGKVEEALRRDLEEKQKQAIRENLMSRAGDKERDREDLQIAEEFLYAENEALERELYERSKTG